ncbi:sel1 repeat family protein [Holdemanella sp. SCCA2]|nr:sel1 repeat family protein [Holdemanella sp. SCCA2]
MKRNYIKMNDNDNYLSLGNVINTIKKVSNNKNAMQTELFYTIFNVNNVNATTINNYCIGYRAIGLEYKRIFIDLKRKFEQDKEIYINIILGILSIMDDVIYVKDVSSLELINTNKKLNEVIKELLIIAQNDKHIEKETINSIKKLNNYEAFIELLNYSILENNQPVYTQSINIKINREELNEYLKIKLYYGESYINSLIELSRKDNMYACAELGSLEFDGYISGKPNYKKCYDYYYKAALKDHPKGCWMVANLMLTGRVKLEFDTMWKYLNKSIELGSFAGYNTLGLCYLRGINKQNKKDLNEARKNFQISAEHGYVFAFNNLGKTYEEEGNIEEAIKYYKVSADMNECWALNKVGEYYRKKRDLKTAYIYYLKATESPITERIKYPFYNLAKYYYENGCEEANIKKDTTKAKELYDIYESLK